MQIAKSLPAIYMSQHSLHLTLSLSPSAELELNERVKPYATFSFTTYMLVSRINPQPAPALVIWQLEI